MFMNVGYTPPPPAWPPKTKGMGVYMRQNFVTPQRLIAALQSAQIQIPQGWGSSGMGCGGGDSCSCGCSKGMGLFDSGTDISGWGLPEWGVIGLGAAAALSLLGNVSSGAKRVRRAFRKRRAA